MTAAQVAVVGRGLIGAAAARHLAEAGLGVTLIGPREAPDRPASSGPFSSHADEGRITRLVGRTGHWSELAAMSVARYGDIEQRSGIRFHHPRGLVVAFGDAHGWVDRGRAMGSDARLVSADWVRETTGIAITNGLPTLYEGEPAGWINPRRLVEAQASLAEAAGATVVEHVAQSLTRRGGVYDVGGVWGSVTADRVLLATGAFGAELLPGDLQLHLQRRPRTTLMAEMLDDQRIPCLILDQPPDDRLHEIYWVPPVRYPDGRVCLKIGGNLKEHPLLDPDELVPWFRSDGSAEEADALEQSLRVLLPNARIEHVDTAPCVVTGTPTGHPYIGWVSEDLAVAVGGNGSAAKSSDELGRLASTLFTGLDWASSIPAADLEPQFG